MARPSLAIGRWISLAGFASPLGCGRDAKFFLRFPQQSGVLSLVLSLLTDKILKIHSPERECRLSLRWRTAESSEAKATAPKANATAKSFLILPLPDTRKFSPTLPTPARSSF